MKRLMVFMVGLAFVFTASASAQQSTPPTAKDAAPAKVQAASVDAKQKKDSKNKKKTNKDKAGETKPKTVVR